jgi:large subunit ribosomal protein L19
VKIKEGDKERIQIFEGVCITKNTAASGDIYGRRFRSRHGSSASFASFKVIDKVEIVRSGRVRRAKL